MKLYTASQFINDLLCMYCDIYLITFGDIFNTFTMTLVKNKLNFVRIILQRNKNGWIFPMDNSKISYELLFILMNHHQFVTCLEVTKNYILIFLTNCATWMCRRILYIGAEFCLRSHLEFYLFVISRVFYGEFLVFNLIFFKKFVKPHGDKKKLNESYKTILPQNSGV